MLTDNTREARLCCKTAMVTQQRWTRGFMSHQSSFCYTAYVQCFSQYTAYVQWTFVTVHSLCAVSVCHSALHRAKALSFPWREGGKLKHIHRLSKPQHKTNRLEPWTAMCVDIKSRILILGGKSSMFWHVWGLHTHGMSPFLKHTKVGWDQIRYIPSLLTAEPIFQTWRHVKSLIWYFHQL